MPRRRVHGGPALLLLLAGPLLAAPPPERGPRLVVSEREVALGAVLEGAVVERRVTLTNGGDAPLVVQHVEVACGCTLGRAPGAPIAPGASADLVLRFDSRGRRGEQRLAVWVYTNDPTQADRGRGCTALALVGEVRTLFSLTPEGAFLGEVLRGEGPSEVVVTIVADPAAAARFAPRVASDAALPDGVEVAIERVAGAPGAARVRVRLAPDVSTGELFHDLTLETGVAEQPRVTLPIIALVSPRVAGPRAVELFDVRRAAGAQRRVTLERRDGRTGLTVLEVTSPLAFVRARVEPVSDVRVDLVLDLLPDAPPGPFATVVEVHLDDPREPLLRLPVVGEVLPRVVLDPPVVLLAPGEEGVVLVRGGRPRDARAKGAGLSVEVEELAPGARARPAGRPRRRRLGRRARVRHPRDRRRGRGAGRPAGAPRARTVNRTDVWTLSGGAGDMLHAGPEVTRRSRRTALGRIEAVLLFVVLGSGWLCIVSGATFPLLRAREKSSRTKCSNNMRQLALAAIMYADDKRFFPHVGPLAQLDGGTDSNATTKVVRALVWYGYHDNPEGFICPNSYDLYVPITDNAVKADLRLWFWAGEARGDPTASPFTDGRPDPTLDATDELSYGWTRRAMNTNARSSTPLLADRAQADPEARASMEATMPGLYGNHDDGSNVAQADGTTTFVAGGSDEPERLSATVDKGLDGFLAIRPPTRTAPRSVPGKEQLGQVFTLVALFVPVVLLALSLAARVRRSAADGPVKLVLSQRGAVAPVRPSRVATLGPEERATLGLGKPRTPGGPVVLQHQQRCPICHDGVGVEDPLSRCLDCRAVFHAECVAPGGPCPTLGCGVRP